MAIVSGFTVQNTIYTDTRIPVQYRGGGQPNGQRAIPFEVFLAAVHAYLGALDSYASDADAIITGGLASGELYWTTNDHEVLPGNVLTRVP